MEASFPAAVTHDISTSIRVDGQPSGPQTDLAKRIKRAKSQELAAWAASAGVEPAGVSHAGIPSSSSSGNLAAVHFSHDASARLRSSAVSPLSGLRDGYNVTDASSGGQSISAGRQHLSAVATGRATLHASPGSSSPSSSNSNSQDGNSSVSPNSIGSSSSNSNHSACIISETGTVGPYSTGSGSNGLYLGIGSSPAPAATVLRFNLGVGSSGLQKHGGLRKGPGNLVDFSAMCKRLWLLAWPLSWMEVLTFTKELIITSYVGHLGAAELSALVLAQTVYNVTGNAPMLGFVTAMETFCGQAYGAQRYNLVGVVLQRGLVISFLYCCFATGLWAWCESVLLYMGQDAHISAAASQFTLALAPALFMDAADQCCRRYLSAQAVVQPLMMVTLLATMLTPLFLYIFVARCGLGLLGAAVAWDAVQATSLTLMVLCCVWHTRSQDAARCTWPGWTLAAFREWPLYIRMAIPSCVMICLDWWTFEVIVMLSGLLPSPEQTMSMMGITFNIHALCFFAAHGLSGAASTRVGNDLGAGRPHMAWVTVQVAVLMGTLVMWMSSGLLLMCRGQLGRLFSGEEDVVLLTAQAVPPLAVSLIGEGANTVLAGILRGCGRQKIGATINLVTYWGFGLPFSCLLAFPGKLGALGLWTGLACSASIQALLMTVTVFRFNWVEEAARAKSLVAAGELILEDEEPFDDHCDSGDEDDVSGGGTKQFYAAGGGSGGSDKLNGHVGWGGGGGGGSGPRTAAGKGDAAATFKIKAVGGPLEQSRLLP